VRQVLVVFELQRPGQLYEIGGVGEQVVEGDFAHLHAGIGLEEVGAAVHGVHGLAVGPVAGVGVLEFDVGYAELVEQGGFVGIL
jgi:hypothetical protein